MRKTAIIDYWKLTRDFTTGDSVQKFMPGYSDISPYMGRVTAVHRGIGFIDVQWPFGNSRESPEDLLKVNPNFLGYLPPTLNHSYYPGLDVTKQGGSNPWRTTEVPPGFHRDLAASFHRGAGEVEAYDNLWRTYASQGLDDDAVKDEVAKFYRFASNTVGLYLQQVQRAIGAKIAEHGLDNAIDKEGTYWAAVNRTHRATGTEIKSGRPNCPRCGTQMRKTTYKMSEGSKIRLFGCPQDLYLIKQDAIMGPQGEPVAW